MPSTSSTSSHSAEVRWSLPATNRAEAAAPVSATFHKSTQYRYTRAPLHDHDRRVSPDVIDRVVEHDAPDLQPAMRSEGTRLHAEYPAREHAVARKELAERESFEQAHVFRREEERPQPGERGDEPLHFLRIERSACTLSLVAATHAPRPLARILEIEA